MDTATNGRNKPGKAQPPRLRLTETGVVVDETVAPDSAQLNDAPATVEPVAEETEATATLLEEGDAPAEAAAETGAARRSHVRRVLRAAGVVAVLLALVAGVGYFWLFHNANSDAAYQVKPSAPANSGGADPTARGLTAEEIAQELNKHAPAVGAVSANTPGSVTPAASLPGQSPITDRLPNQDFSATVTPIAAPSTATASGRPANAPMTAGPSLVSTGPAATPATAHSTAPPSPTPAPASSYAAHSIRARVEKVNGNLGATGNARAAATPSTTASPTPASTPPATVDSTAAQTTPTTHLPPLGTLLPVRTLAQVYTVRAASYVRLQLTRDMAGPGWSLRRGTEFYGQLRGAETATGRVFVTLLGYIEPETNLWRELPGQLLGADGTEGLPGHTHKLNAGWRKALKKAGSVALETVTAITSGLGRRPVVITDGGAGRVLDPLAQEAQGLAGTRAGDSFIEVPAATAGYILVITDPQDSRQQTAGSRQ